MHAGDGAWPELHIHSLYGTYPRPSSHTHINQGARRPSSPWSWHPGTHSITTRDGRTPAAPDGAPQNHCPVTDGRGGTTGVLILYADGDFPGCDRMSDELYRALAARQVEAGLLEIKNRSHVSIMFRLMMSEVDPATQALLAFVARHAGMALAPRPEPAIP